MSGIFGLFNLFALLFIFRGSQVVLRIIREWKPLKQEPLSPAKKSLANQATVFLTIPPSIIVHEFFHALATWLVGGKIIDYGFGVVYGYVVPFGDFTPQENWFISIAGTGGTMVFGTAVYLLLRRHPISSFRFFGLRTLRFQLHWALIYYPVFTIFVPTVSDWRIVYDFSATLVLSGLTAVAHISALYLFYLADRRGWFEMAGFETVSEQDNFRQLKQKLTMQPQERRLTMQYIDSLWRGGAAHKATSQLKTYLEQHPDDADGYALLAAFQSGKSNHITSKSKANAEKALHLGVSDPRRKALTFRILGEYALERNHYQEALDHFSQAISTLSGALNKDKPQANQQHFLAELYYRRSLAYRRQNNFDLAYQDVQQAIDLSEAAGGDGRLQFYQQEQTIIQQHAGRNLGNAANVPSREDVV